ncbi:MAG: urease accessory protein UreD [Pseudomonadota bacterium]
MNVIAPRPEKTAAQADLVFAKSPDGKTFLARQFVPYPFHITRPFYLDLVPAGMATVYLQSAAGGTYRGDRLGLNLTVKETAAAHVTTQASTLVNAGRGGQVTLHQRFLVGRHGLLEFMPDPLILLAGADCRTETEIHLQEEASLLYCDAVLAHDPEERGLPPRAFRSHLRLLDASKRPVLIDRYVLGMPGASLDSLGDLPCHATFLCVAPQMTPELASKLSHELSDRDSVYAGVSLLREDSGLWVRLIATDGVALTKSLHFLWKWARLAITGRPAALRRK